MPRQNLDKFYCCWKWERRIRGRHWIRDELSRSWYNTPAAVPFFIRRPFVPEIGAQIINNHSSLMRNINSSQKSFCTSTIVCKPFPRLCKKLGRTSKNRGIVPDPPFPTTPRSLLLRTFFRASGVARTRNTNPCRYMRTDFDSFICGAGRKGRRQTARRSVHKRNIRHEKTSRYFRF